MRRLWPVPRALTGLASLSPPTGRRVRGAAVATAAVLAVAASAASASAAPFANGSFETPLAPAASFVTIATGGSIGPWTVIVTGAELGQCTSL